MGAWTARSWTLATGPPSGPQALKRERGQGREGGLGRPKYGPRLISGHGVGGGKGWEGGGCGCMSVHWPRVGKKKAQRALNRGQARTKTPHSDWAMGRDLCCSVVEGDRRG